MTRESNPGPRARISNALTTKPLSHNTLADGNFISDTCITVYKESLQSTRTAKWVIIVVVIMTGLGADVQ